MVQLGTIDLEFLLLGINGNGEFNENDIEDSSLKRLGVGRILDTLASLKDRNLIGLNTDGTFRVTELAMNHLWKTSLPLGIRILRLLEIKSYTTEEISEIIKEEKQLVDSELEELRKKELVLMSPIRKEERIIPIFEILPEGKEYLEKTKRYGFSAESENQTRSKKISILVNEVKKEIQDQDKILQDKKKEILAKLDKIKESLEI